MSLPKNGGHITMNESFMEVVKNVCPTIHCFRSCFKYRVSRKTAETLYRSFFFQHLIIEKLHLVLQEQFFGFQEPPVMTKYI